MQILSSIMKMQHDTLKGHHQQHARLTEALMVIASIGRARTRQPRWVRFGLSASGIALLATASLVAPAALAEEPSRIRAPLSAGVKKQAVVPELASQRIAILEQTGRSFRQLSAAPAPPGLDSRHARRAAEYDRWLLKTAKACEELARRWERALAGASTRRPEDPLASATREMQEMNQSFSLQYLGLQQKIQNENRQFSMMSAVMKVKHDTAKAAINNIR